MSTFGFNLKPIVAALAVTVMYSLPAAGQGTAGLPLSPVNPQVPVQPDSLQSRLSDLYDRLASASPAEARGLEREIRLEWRKTGSPAMDLLLKRGRDALERRDFAAAIDHLTALTDHSPDVAEAFHARARAYYQSGLVGPAVADLEQALALDPRHYEAAHGLAVVLEELGRAPQAYAAYRLVLSIHPHYDPAAEAVTRLKTKVEGLKI
jgi:tetratricopeptide (TPR) repeat protein